MFLGNFGRYKGFLLSSTEKQGRNKEKVGEEIMKFGQNIYPTHPETVDKEDV